MLSLASSPNSSLVFPSIRLTFPASNSFRLFCRPYPASPISILYPASLIAGILCFCWIATTSSGGIIAFVCFYGPASGSYVATIPAVLAGMTKNMNEIGMRSSLAFAAIR